jgi:hypothetical protein
VVCSVLFPSRGLDASQPSLEAFEGALLADLQGAGAGAGAGIRGAGKAPGSAGISLQLPSSSSSSSSSKSSGSNSNSSSNSVSSGSGSVGYQNSTVFLYFNHVFHDTPDGHIESQMRVETVVSRVRRRMIREAALAAAAGTHTHTHSRKSDPDAMDIDGGGIKTEKSASAEDTVSFRRLAVLACPGLIAPPAWTLPLVHAPAYLRKLRRLAEEARRTDLLIPLEFDSDEYDDTNALEEELREEESADTAAAIAATATAAAAPADDGMQVVKGEQESSSNSNSNNSNSSIDIDTNSDFNSDKASCDFIAEALRLHPSDSKYIGIYKKFQKLAPSASPSDGSGDGQSDDSDGGSGGGAGQSKRRRKRKTFADGTSSGRGQGGGGGGGSESEDGSDSSDGSGGSSSAPDGGGGGSDRGGGGGGGGAGGGGRERKHNDASDLGPADETKLLRLVYRLIPVIGSKKRLYTACHIGVNNFNHWLARREQQPKVTRRDGIGTVTDTF